MIVLARLVIRPLPPSERRRAIDATALISTGIMRGHALLVAIPVSSVTPPLPAPYVTLPKAELWLLYVTALMGPTMTEPTSNASAAITPAKLAPREAPLLTATHASPLSLGP